MPTQTIYVSWYICHEYTLIISTQINRLCYYYDQKDICKPNMHIYYIYIVYKMWIYTFANIISNNIFVIYYDFYGRD